jgi:hypothetical protein
MRGRICRRHARDETFFMAMRLLASLRSKTTAQ